MSTNKPAWASEYVTYEDIVKSWGLKVVAFETFGSYQGDHLALVERRGEIGVVIFGYGSCSGCDELQAITPYAYDEGEPVDWSPVTNFAAKLRDSIHWEASRDALRDWIDGAPENHWWCYDDEIARYLNTNLGTSLKVEDY